MGNWNISISAVGCHHNGKPEIDADLAFVDFVAKLKTQGHTIESAHFTYGGAINGNPKVDTETDKQLNLARRTGLTDIEIAKVLENARHQYVARITTKA